MTSMGSYIEREAYLSTAPLYSTKCLISCSTSVWENTKTSASRLADVLWPTVLKLHGPVTVNAVTFQSIAKTGPHWSGLT